jgi:hypothetical protein
MAANEVLPEMIESVRTKTGLEPDTIIDLLSKGWRYVENLGEISRWEHPMWQLEERNVSTPGMYELLSIPLID